MAYESARSGLGEGAVSDLLRSITIPPCPAVVSALLSEVRSDAADYQRVGRLLSGDVSLAASMMKTANSPYFGLHRKVPSVSQALAVLGLRNVASIVTGLALQRAVTPPGLNMERFWERSGLHAVVCARMARHLPEIGREDAYTYGLFHDCGIPILMQRFPDYKQTLAEANRSLRPMGEIEFERHATSHMIVGGMLAANWQLPELVVEAIRLHHDPEVVRGEAVGVSEAVRALVSVSLIAEHLVADMLGHDSDAEWEVAGADALAYLGLDELELDEIRTEVAEDIHDISCLRN